MDLFDLNMSERRHLFLGIRAAILFTILLVLVKFNILNALIELEVLLLLGGVNVFQILVWIFARTSRY